MKDTLAEPTIERALREAADRVAARLPVTLPRWGDYVTELTVEAWLLCEGERGDAAEALAFALARKESRGERPDSVIPWRQRPFVALEWELAHRAQDARYLFPWLDETRRWRDEVARSREGLVMHRSTDGHGGVLLDDLQEYAARCLRGGVWARDESLVEEGLKQWERAERLLRDPVTGQWSQGRGWCDDPEALSPGAWSRGHGWLLRGLVSGLAALEEMPGAQARLRPVLERALSSLARTQSGDGAWHARLDLPPSESPPDASGTGMIVHYAFHAWRRGWLEDRDAWGSRLVRAAGWLAGCVDAAGRVHRSCPGPGPLREASACCGREPFPVDEPHGAPTLLLAAAAGAHPDFPWTR